MASQTENWDMKVFQNSVAPGEQLVDNLNIAQVVLASFVHNYISLKSYPQKITFSYVNTYKVYLINI